MPFVNTTLMTLAALSIFAVLSPATADDDTILGTWRGKYAESCKAASDQSTEDFLTIGRKKIMRYEGECEIVKQAENRDVHEIQILCETEGEVVRDVLKIKVVNRDRINIEGAGNYDRCK